jgi:hypothetical protein
MNKNSSAAVGPAVFDVKSNFEKERIGRIKKITVFLLSKLSMPLPIMIVLF